MAGPLTGIRVIELAGIGPAPMAGQLLADLGADVISIDRRAEDRMPQRPKDANRRGKRSIVLNLKEADAVNILLKLCETSDMMFEGFRPGVAERLGVGPDSALNANPALVYGRLTGWGQDGPLSARAGHDINYIALSGALAAIGGPERPLPPINLVGDYAGGSLVLIVGMLAALVRARATGQGEIVDAAMTEGSAAIMSLIHSLMASGLWTEKRDANLIDGGAPFYRTYRTRDGQFMAVGAIEGQFFAELLDRLGLDPKWIDHQHDQSQWSEMTALFVDTFGQKTRSEWEIVFDGSDACVSPVLIMSEAPGHPHNQARKSFVERDGFVQPSPVPRFTHAPAELGRGAYFAGEDTQALLKEIGYSDQAIVRFLVDEIAGQSQ